MTTWMEIMREVQRLDTLRTSGKRLNEDDAERLVTMLLAFHQGAVVKVPTPSKPRVPQSVEGKGR